MKINSIQLMFFILIMNSFGIIWNLIFDFYKYKLIPNLIISLTFGIIYYIIYPKLKENVEKQEKKSLKYWLNKK